ncbi:solute carrier family 49 member A3 [Petromyzon marinus]|uniref:Solute carrier family 49 member A3 n=1 Tax=Petromyzon marinus TaxID=7757 RepID=A0AAJ7SYC7_PETMA|nr:solute carrier family 49 member A3 [Petromyzon marinus]
MSAEGEPGAVAGAGIGGAASDAAGDGGETGDLNAEPVAQAVPEGPEDRAVVESRDRERQAVFEEAGTRVGLPGGEAGPRGPQSRAATSEARAGPGEAGNGTMETGRREGQRRCEGTGDGTVDRETYTEDQDELKQIGDGPIEDCAGSPAPEARALEPENFAGAREPRDQTMESEEPEEQPGSEEPVHWDVDPKDQAGLGAPEDQAMTPEQDPEDQAGLGAPEDQTMTPEQDPEDQAGLGAPEDQAMTPEQDHEDQAGLGVTEDRPMMPEQDPEDQAGLGVTEDQAMTPEQDPEDQAGLGVTEDQAMTPEQDPEDQAGLGVTEDRPMMPEQDPEDQAGLGVTEDQAMMPEQDPEDQAGLGAPENRPLTPEQDPEDQAELGVQEDQTMTPEQDPEDQAGPDQTDDEATEHKGEIEDQAEPEEPEDRMMDSEDQIRPGDVENCTVESVKLEDQSGCSEEPKDQDINTEDHGLGRSIDQNMQSGDLEDQTVTRESEDRTVDPEIQVESEKADDRTVEPENLTGDEETKNQNTALGEQAKQEEPEDRICEPEEVSPEQLGEPTIDYGNRIAEPEALARQGHHGALTVPGHLVKLKERGDLVWPLEAEDLAGKPEEAGDELVEPIEFGDMAKPESVRTGSMGEHGNWRRDPMLGAWPKEPRIQGEPGDLIDVALDQDEPMNQPIEQGEPRGLTRPRDLGNQAIRSWDLIGPGEDGEKLLGMTEDPEDSLGSVDSGAHVYHVYARRWFVLAVLCLLNLSNALIWLSFAPIADKAATFFGISLAQVNWLAIVFLVACIPCGIVASWSMDSIGLRVTLVLGSWLNALGSVLRALSDHPLMPTALKGFPLLMTGQTLGALAQPFLLFAPTKLAAVWFPDSQRATANTLASMSNPLGILLANVLSPTIVYEADQMPMMLYLYCLPAVLACALATCGVCSGSPPTPPSLGATHPTGEPFWRSVKAVMTNKPYLVLFFCFGAGVALFTAFTTLLEQILCSRGYSDSFSGLCGALTIGFGIIGAGLVGFYVDRSKKFVEVAKINFCLAALAACVFAMVCGMREQEYVIAVACCVFGMFGFSIYPVCMELGVECTYPVGEATSSGILFISGQLQGVLYIVLMQVVARPLPATAVPTAVCHGNGMTPQDWTVSVLLFAGIAMLGACCMVVAFRTEYRRRKAEAVESSESEPLLV